MKLAPRDIDSFVKKPPSGFRAVLLYGVDGGLIRSRRDALLAALRVDRSDPFACTELTHDAVEETPSLLFEALQSMTLTGQAPCVLVSDVGNKLTDTIKCALTTPACSNPLILIAGDLAKGSLRTLFEDAKRKDCITIACYRDEGADLATTIRAMLQEKGIACTPPVMQVLCSLLGNDRAVTRSEIEKIDLYLGVDRTLTEEIVVELLGNNQHTILSDAAMAWIAGDMARFMTLSDRVFQAGEHPVAFVRVLLSAVSRLLTIVQKIAEGAAPAQAMMAARPPVFFKEQPLYTRAIKRWNTGDLLRLIAFLQNMEASVKNTPTPELLLVQGLTMYKVGA
jgi:DNA polymerase III subunit delta